MHEAGIGTYILFQETYHKESYEQLHPTGPKHNYAWHTEAMDRAMEGGIDDVGLGVLFGLERYKYEFAGLLMHAEHLEAVHGVGPHTISVPRIRAADDIDPASFANGIDDDTFAKIVACIRIAVPYTGMIVSTRESQKCRERVLHLGISQISGGSVDYLAQGTIYPDVIESGTNVAAVIKSHHNVGGLPDFVDFKEIIEPLRLLFKDEVRALGRELGLPEYLVMRQPFPGPGLAIRCLGAVSKDKLDILRDADFIFRDEIAKAHLEQTMNQYFAVLTNMRSVGVMGDGRTYDYTLALRSVTTTDFMTANWTRIPYDVLDRVSVRIVNEVKGINRIVYDITSKPPATIEWE